MANGNGNIIWNSRIQLQLSDQYGEWEQRLHESGALPDQRRESAQLYVNKLTILRLSALIFSQFVVLSILWIEGVESAPLLDIYLCSLWCPSAFNTLYMWLYCVHLVSTFCTICLKIALWKWFSDRVPKFYTSLCFTNENSWKVILSTNGAIWVSVCNIAYKLFFF